MLYLLPKKEGHNWRRVGMDSIGPLITATRNGALEKAPIYNAAGKICKKMDRQMYKSVVEAVNASQKATKKTDG